MCGVLWEPQLCPYVLSLQTACAHTPARCAQVLTTSPDSQRNPRTPRKLTSPSYSGWISEGIFLQAPSVLCLKTGDPTHTHVLCEQVNRTKQVSLVPQINQLSSHLEYKRKYIFVNIRRAVGLFSAYYTATQPYFSWQLKHLPSSEIWKYFYFWHMYSMCPRAHTPFDD